jgi:hypothetical protein
VKEFGSDWSTHLHDPSQEIQGKGKNEGWEKPPRLSREWIFHKAPCPVRTKARVVNELLF